MVLGLEWKSFSETEQLDLQIDTRLKEADVRDCECLMQFGSVVYNFFKTFFSDLMINK